ncbi:hypothetical protein C9374_014491 [Naegleria lovaniensis]|uniref:Ig protease IdeS domain-containing protein n=1 Tax=Naegleria lovaniensis TaxID=51637 RepID=A0AA88GZX3_NAELO|nr:uncharacterized protein C9374_014491 [Naegleria lovaniensis]KAG2389091.1 hypothetical protein C9374_014491 [Naegleria lovaniensis]
MFKWSRLNHNTAEEDLNGVSSQLSSQNTSTQVVSNTEITTRAHHNAKGPIENPFTKSGVLPSEVVINIVTFMDLKTLFYFAVTDRFMLKFLFHQSPSQVQEYIKLKQHVSSEEIHSSSEKQFPKVINAYKKQEEQVDFELVQRLIWKALVCYYFPQFEKTLNIKNWMQVLRRRVNHLKLYAPLALPLHQNMEKDPFKLSNALQLPLDDTSFFIEGCEFNYKCPLKYDQLQYSTNNTRYCTKCNKTVYGTNDVSEFKTHASLGHCVAFSLKRESFEIDFMGDVCFPMDEQNTL